MWWDHWVWAGGRTPETAGRRCSSASPNEVISSIQLTRRTVFCFYISLKTWIIQYVIIYWAKYVFESLYEACKTVKSPRCSIIQYNQLLCRCYDTRTMPVIMTSSRNNGHVLWRHLRQWRSFCILATTSKYLKIVRHRGDTQKVVLHRGDPLRKITVVCIT